MAMQQLRSLTALSMRITVYLPGQGPRGFCKCIQVPPEKPLLLLHQSGENQHVSSSYGSSNFLPASPLVPYLPWVQRTVWEVRQLPFPTAGDLPDPGIEPESPPLAGTFLTTKPPASLMSPSGAGKLSPAPPGKPLIPDYLNSKAKHC